MTPTFLAIAVKLGTGSAQYIIAKILMDWRTMGLGQTEPSSFKKNYFFQVIVYLSSFLIILPLFYQECRKFNVSRKLSGLPAKHAFSLNSYLITFLPSFLDFLAVTLSLFSNKYLPVTTSILLKSLRIVVTAFLTGPLLGHPQQPYNWLGVFLTVVGVVPTALAASFRVADKKDSVWIYIMLTVVAEVMRGFRSVFEERLMKKQKLSAEFVTFCESALGLILSLVLWLVVHLIPGTDNGSLESIPDTFHRLGGSSVAIILLTGNLILVGIHNYSNSLVTKYLTAVHCAVIGQVRPLFTWVPNIIIWRICVQCNAYEMKKGKVQAYYGEPLDLYSIFEIIGMIVIALGTLIYSGILKVPFVALYPNDQQKKPEDSDTPKIQV